MIRRRRNYRGPVPVVTETELNFTTVDRRSPGILVKNRSGVSADWDWTPFPVGGGLAESLTHGPLLFIPSIRSLQTALAFTLDNHLAVQRHSSLVSNPTTAKLDLLAGFNVSFRQSTAGQRDLEALARSFYSGAFVGSRFRAKASNRKDWFGTEPISAALR